MLKSSSYIDLICDLMAAVTSLESIFFSMLVRLVAQSEIPSRLRFRNTAEEDRLNMIEFRLSLVPSIAGNSDFSKTIGFLDIKG